jgi:hypothetical protein
MGEVVEAAHIELGKTYAVKLLHPDLVPLARRTAMGSEGASRSGARAAAKLTLGFGAEPHRNKTRAARSRREAAQKSGRTFGERH